MTVMVAYLSLGGEILFNTPICFDFRKYNLMIFVIRSFFPYPRPIFLDFWKDNLMILVIRSLSPY